MSIHNYTNIPMVKFVTEQAANLSGNITSFVIEGTYNISKGQPESLIRLDRCAYLCENSVRVIYHNQIIGLICALFVALMACYYITAADSIKTEDKQKIILSMFITLAGYAAYAYFSLR